MLQRHSTSVFMCLFYKELLYIATTLLEKHIYIYPSLNLALVNVPLESQVLSFLIHYLLKFEG